MRGKIISVHLVWCTKRSIAVYPSRDRRELQCASIHYWSSRNRVCVHSLVRICYVHNFIIVDREKKISFLSNYSAASRMAPRLALHHFRRDFRMQSTLRTHRLIDFRGPYCVCVRALCRHSATTDLFSPGPGQTHIQSVSQRRNNIQINN